LFPSGPSTEHLHTGESPILSILHVGSVRPAALLFSFLGLTASCLHGQQPTELFPERSLLPRLLAGVREPVTSASLLGVVRNPNEFGAGMEAEVSLGSGLPVVVFRHRNERSHVAVGIEASVYARFGLQIRERELIATDWIFTVPVVWHRGWGWARFRYYHASSHIGDEYSRRFGDQGVNFSRDAADALAYYQAAERVGLYGGLRFAYNVKPEESRRWVLRAGGQWEEAEAGRLLRPFVAVDVEWDQDAGPDPRLSVNAGSWLLPLEGRRAVRLVLGFLVGPSPLGQFQGERTTQLTLGLVGHL
jgi:hypothetical protein